MLANGRTPCSACDKCKSPSTAELILQGVRFAAADALLEGRVFRRFPPYTKRARHAHTVWMVEVVKELLRIQQQLWGFTPYSKKRKVNGNRSLVNCWAPSCSCPLRCWFDWQCRRCLPRVLFHWAITKKFAFCFAKTSAQSDLGLWLVVKEIPTKTGARTDALWPKQIWIATLSLLRKKFLNWNPYRILMAVSAVQLAHHQNHPHTHIILIPICLFDLMITPPPSRQIASGRDDDWTIVAQFVAKRFSKLSTRSSGKSKPQTKTTSTQKSRQSSIERPK